MSPFDARYWNLIQTLGWVYLRDRWWVDFSADRAHETRVIAKPYIVPGGRTKTSFDPAPPASRIGIIAKAATMGCTRFDSLNEVEAAVLNALQFGRVRCRGTRNGEGDITDIPAPAWDDLEFHENPDRAGPHHALVRPGATYWHYLRFEREDVLREWPDPTEARITTAETDTSTPESEPASVEEPGTSGRADVAESEGVDAERVKGEPKPETVAKWKADYDVIKRLMRVHNLGPLQASKRAYAPGDRRTAGAIERGWRRYKDHIGKTAKRQ